MRSAATSAASTRPAQRASGSYALPEPFFILATENPVEFEGTFPLPEVQKDRFFLSLSIGYPSAETERELMLIKVRAVGKEREEMKRMAEIFRATVGPDPNARPFDVALVDLRIRELLVVQPRA